MSLRRRKYRRGSKAQPKLNLVALMDIFTILVFFLMVNSSEVQVMQSEKKIALPTSSAKQAPKETLTLVVSQSDIIVQGRPIVSIDKIPKDGELIRALTDELNHQAARRTQPRNQETGLPITIFGDQQIPYQLLKKILATCAKSDYRNISLAVKQTLDKTTEATTERVTSASRIKVSKDV